MMRLIVINSIVSLAFLLVGCDKFLDTKPTDFFSPSSYYQKEEHLEFALAGVYDILGHNKLYAAELHSRHNMEADEGFWNGSTTNTGRSVYNFTVGDPDVRLFWQTLYLGVSRANTLLANVNNNLEIDEQFRNRVRGEALFLRAYYYYLLVQNFENVPLILSPVTNSNDVDIAASYAVDIYEKIILDMEEAEALVDPIESIGHGGRVSKSAVRGILARVCLNMAGEPVRDVSKYEKASFWAKKVIDDVNAAHELNPDYSDVFIKYAKSEYDIKESIWEVEFYGNGQNADQEYGYVGSWIGITNNSGNNNIGFSFGRILATGKHFRIYKSGDVRRDWNIAPFVYRTDGTKSFYPTSVAPDQQYRRAAGKYRREFEPGNSKSGQFTSINFPLLRYADVLLMYAESENEIHGRPTPEAFEALNKVVRRGYGRYLPDAVGSIDAYDYSSEIDDKYLFFRAIVDERSKELCFEALRRPDLIRWGIFVETMKLTLQELTADLGATAWQGLTYRNASQKHVIYPIPSYELEVNKLLIQHPLWN